MTNIYEFNDSNINEYIFTLPWVNAPTTAGTRNPGMVAAMLVIPISTPRIRTLFNIFKGIENSQANENQDN